MSAIHLRKNYKTKNDKTTIPFEYLPTQEENKLFLNRTKIIY